MAEKDTEALWPVAYHEAGHAVVGWHLGRGLRKEGVTIVPDEKAGTGGSCSSKRVVGRDAEYDPSARNRLRAEIDVQALLAGEIAQRRYNPRSVRRYHAAGDRHEMNDLFYRFIDKRFVDHNPEMDAWEKLLRIRTETLFADPDIWRAVERLAAALMERRTIPGEEATAILYAGWRERTYAEHPEWRKRDEDLAAALMKAYKPKRRKGDQPVLMPSRAISSQCL